MKANCPVALSYGTAGGNTRPKFVASVGSMLRSALAPLVLCLVASAATGADAPPDEPATELDPISVTPGYLYESDRQLSRIARSLPDFGEPAKDGALGPLSDFFEKRGDVNKLDPLQQDMLLRTLGEADDRWR